MGVTCVYVHVLYLDYRDLAFFWWQWDLNSGLHTW
jgi:hypothetical protein